ncbi:MAG: metallophosphatase family protein [Bacteroidales bacterium]|nr:metallophosphatase family protein [Bacteroidales bacterium]
MYIGLISDTHGVFDDEFRRFLEPVDCIWHAGDWGGGEDFTRTISSFKPVTGVHGNCDGQDVRWLYPAVQNFECEGLKVLMTHIGGSPGHYDYRAHALIDSVKPDIFVCGHSHILKVMRDNANTLMYINPGAAGLHGWQVVRTALRFKIEGGKIFGMEVFEFPR